MAKNSLGREIPAQWRGRTLDPYLDPWSRQPEVLRATRPLVRRAPGDSKLLPSLRAAIEACGLKNGMTISTHHALRNGDLLLNLLVKEMDAMGLRDMGIASSSVHGVHAEIIPSIRNGTITRIELRDILDLSPREVAVFAPLVILTLWMGVYPSSFTGFWDASVGAMVEHHQAALATAVKLAGVLH